MGDRPNLIVTKDDSNDATADFRNSKVEFRPQYSKSDRGNPEDTRSILVIRVYFQENMLSNANQRNSCRIIIIDRSIMNADSASITTTIITAFTYHNRTTGCSKKNRPCEPGLQNESMPDDTNFRLTFCREFSFFSVDEWIRFETNDVI